VLQPPPTASRGVKEAHEQVTTGRAENTGIPCANGFNGFLRALPGEPGFFATVVPEKLASQEFDTSVGMSGPHDFAVRAQRHSSFSTSPASIASRLTFRDDSAYAPLAEAGRREFWI